MGDIIKKKYFLKTVGIKDNKIQENNLVSGVMLGTGRFCSLMDHIYDSGPLRLHWS